MNSLGVIFSVAICLCAVQSAIAECRWECWTSNDTVYCGWRCTFKKRSIGHQNELPCHFENYDDNADGSITMDELATQVGTYVKPSAMKAAFFMMDANDDGMVDRNEFKNGPLYKRSC